MRRVNTRPCPSPLTNGFALFSLQMSCFSSKTHTTKVARACTQSFPKNHQKLSSNLQDFPQSPKHKPSFRRYNKPVKAAPHTHRETTATHNNTLSMLRRELHQRHLPSQSPPLIRAFRKDIKTFEEEHTSKQQTYKRAQQLLLMQDL